MLLTSIWSRASYNQVPDDDTRSQLTVPRRPKAAWITIVVVLAVAAMLVLIRNHAISVKTEDSRSELVRVSLADGSAVCNDGRPAVYYIEQVLRSARHNFRPPSAALQIAPTLVSCSDHSFTSMKLRIRVCGSYIWKEEGTATMPSRAKSATKILRS